MGHRRTALPHPLDLEKFAVVAIDPTGDIEQMACEYRRGVRRVHEQSIDRCVARIRGQIKEASKMDGPHANLETAKAYAIEAAKREVRTGRGCWNESYLQHGIIDLWQLERDPRWIDMVIPRVEQVWAQRSDRVGEVDPNWGVVQPTWYERVESGGALALTTGVTIYPITRLIRTVYDEPAMRSYWSVVEKWIPLCRQSIAAHDKEWLDLPDGTGNYLEPYPKGPRRIYPGKDQYNGSRLCPLNRAFSLAMPMLQLGKLLDDAEYVGKVERMARYFQNSCEELPNGSLVWEYLTGRYPAEGEDISHAHIQWLFAELCEGEGIVFTEDDLRKIAATLEKNVFKYDDVPCGEIRGYNPGLHFAVASWATACRLVPHILPKIVAVLETAMRTTSFDFEHQGWGVRLLTTVEKARHSVAATLR